MKDNTELANRAKELRRNMTIHERKLWYNFLRTYKVKFIRQYIIAPYIVDFYCRKANLVIEIDGGQHYSDEGKQYDNNRTEVLQNKGILVLRFSDSDIVKNFYEVCAVIDRTVVRCLEKGDSA